jgi:hypothetical protein
MSPFNESKHAVWVITKKRALPPLIHNFIGFRVFKVLWYRTGDNYLIVLMQKSLMFYKSYLIHGLPKILPFSAGLMLSQVTYNTMPVPQPLHNISYITLVA